jgi:dTDP-4-amino-4,6-dideoxygalactose transaminase
MISYVAPKYGKFQRVKSLLAISRKLNHFTNNGPVKDMLEGKLAAILGLNSNKKVICLSSGTSALHALMFLEQRDGPKRWACPAFTFPSAVVGGAFDVDILDISPDTATLPLDHSLLKPYDGIILTTLFGSHIDLALWEQYCDLEKKTLIIDNASSPLSKVDGKNICQYGKYTFGSLHHTKYLGVGEGGFAVVPAEDYSDMLAISNFGFNDNREHHALSSNFKMSDISAAHTLGHVEKYNVQRHVDIQNSIVDQLKDVEAIRFLNYGPEVVYGNLPIVFHERSKTDHVYFQSMNVVANKYYKPLGNFPHSQKLYDQIVNLPLYDSLTKTEIRRIVEAAKTYSGVK